MFMPTAKNNNNEEGGGGGMPAERPSKVGKHYQVIRKIGEGSFGIIYLAKSDLCDQLVAVKFESRKSVAPQLKDEYRCYQYLKSFVLSDPVGRTEAELQLERELRRGIPLAHYEGQEPLYNYMIMDYLGPSLEEIFEKCGRRFSLKTTSFLAIQMITRVQTIHKKDYIYRDIKPDNFLLGRGDKSDEKTIFIVDFGMAKPYKDFKTNQHIPFREKKSLSGTARYMSINTHLGREQSRRDDLEALGNVFMYFLRGSLPWQGLKARDNREKYERIGQKKQAVRIEDLCMGLPTELASYVSYARRLGFEEEPNYDQCRAWFQTIYDQCDPSESLDWANLKAESIKSWSKGGHYESPKSTPDHLPMTHHQQRTDRGIASSKMAPPPPPIKSPLRHAQSPIEVAGVHQQKRGFFRRLFCLCNNSS